eukprot:TRINITY_DN37420_c0_g1_i1.p1 TRINITY_DN37420_c0_g1~~TRINITY_DN37420_c0_g1_i1.p1  ORF type:complete len:176 (-),score=22.90 TRINITY_DN37420_c0_g1_i1:67-594(-)
MQHLPPRYTLESRFELSAFLLGTHPRLGAGTLPFKLAKRGPWLMKQIARFVLVPSVQLMTSSDDGTLRLSDMDACITKQVFCGHAASVNAFDVDWECGHMISGSNSGEVLLWSLESGTAISELKGHTGRINSMMLDWSTKRALSVSEDQTMRFWDVGGGGGLGHCLHVLPWRESC